MMIGAAVLLALLVGELILYQAGGQEREERKNNCCFDYSLDPSNNDRAVMS